ncbi:MAG: hypothetical protein PVS2B2_04750 [Candidatus Acidiferrum sp.]
MTTKLRFLIVLGSLLGIFPGATVSSTDLHDADRAGINQVLSDQQSAWNKGDSVSFLRGYWHSPDLTFSGSGGTTRGWDDLLARYEKQYPNATAMGHLEFSHLEFRFLGPDAALVLGEWHLAREKDEMGGVFTLVWQRFPEGWRIIHDHTSLAAWKP